MPAYVVTNVLVTDPDQYRKYTVAGHAAVIANGGRFLVEGGKPELFEGDWLPKRMAIVEFPSVEAAKRFYASPDYVAARKERAGAAQFNMIVVQGT